MQQSKPTRHTLAFGIIVTASLALYPATKGDKIFIIWLLLALIVAATTLTLREK
jgi:hypothetical protein